jgi:hypothetical protein
MKKILALLFVVGCFNVYAQKSNQPDTLPVIKFETITHDFGKIKEGTLATYSFVFQNTGKSPLILTNVQASCGCTAPEWPKEPIMPGQKAAIKVVYNSYGRPGVFTKTVLVHSNAGADIILTIKGEALVNTPEPVSPVRINQN